MAVIAAKCRFSHWQVKCDRMIERLETESFSVIWLPAGLACLFAICSTEVVAVL